MCPCRDFTIVKDRPPWFNLDIIELCTNRDHFYSVGRRTKNLNLLK